MTRSLLLLHGFTGSPRSWRAVLERLGLERRVLAPALLGHDGEPGGAEFEAEADRLAALAEAMEPPVHLAGYSLGARVALAMLVRHPDRFGAATLIGVNPGLRDEDERARRRADDEQWARLLEKQGLDTFVERWSALPLWASQADADPELIAEQARIRAAQDAHGLARSLRVLGLGSMPDYHERVRDIEVPVTLMTGALDTKFEAIADTMAGVLPRARRLTVAGAGHNLLLEAPQAVADALNHEPAGA